MPGLSLSDMRELVRKGLGGLDSSEMPDAEVDRLLNLSFWEAEFNIDYKEKECRVSFTTTDGENQYTIPDENDPVDLEAIRSMSILDENDISHKLRRMTQQFWDEVYSHDRGEDERGLPERYVRMDETLQFHPTPDRDDYTVRIYFFKTLSSILSGSVEDLDLPRSWDEIVVEGAIARGHFYNQDYNLARQAENFPIRKRRAAESVRRKEEADSGYAGLRVVRDWPD